MDDDDPLLSITQVARLYGTGIRAVVDLVNEGKIMSLDEGRFLAKGRLDVPVIRRSWATALMQDSQGASRRIDDPGGDIHPAAKAALDFYTALDTNDHDGVARLSSRASGPQLTRHELFEVWNDELAWIFAEPSGVGTAVYSLAPLQAVAARIFADPPAVPRAIHRPTPMTMLVALPLIEEDDAWKIDLSLFRKRDEWVHSLSEPLPSEGLGDEGGRASAESAASRNRT